MITRRFYSHPALIEFLKNSKKLTQYNVMKTEDDKGNEMWMLSYPDPHPGRPLKPA